MSNTIITVENLGKQYKLGERQPYKTFREFLVQTIQVPFRGAKNFFSSKNILGCHWRDGKRFLKSSFDVNENGLSGNSSSFWALKDVSFNVMQGEVVGIIGRNGAGKSTLLKILSRITEPTEGKIRMKGRVASLLEVGTGFHPELTGRENIYLNGTILGMRRQEVKKNFDRIVEFAEIEGFLDTPVKRYSSGMYVRLAFAVAAHLNSEILLIDEVLAVGDLAFQRKCLGKISDVTTSGRTVFFVSHNMAAIENLSSRCLLLSEGKVKFFGSTKDCIREYMLLNSEKQKINESMSQGMRMKGKGKFTSFRMLGRNGEEVVAIPMGAPVTFLIEIEASENINNPNVGMALTTHVGQRLLRLNTSDVGFRVPQIKNKLSIACDIPHLPLLPGYYNIAIGLSEGEGNLQDYIEQVASLEIIPSDIFGTGRIPKGPGDLIFIKSKWTIKDDA